MDDTQKDPIVDPIEETDEVASEEAPIEDEAEVADEEISAE